MRNFSKILVLIFLGFGSLSLPACVATRPYSLVEKPTQEAGWPAIIAKARLDLETDPESVVYQAALVSAIQGAEDHYIKVGRAHLADDDIASAEGIFSRALLLMPESQTLKDELKSIKQKRQAHSLIAKAQGNLKLGRINVAARQLEEALELDPQNRVALRTLNQAYGSKPIQTAPKTIRLRSGAPVTVNFKNADMKDAFLMLAENFGLNIIFDSALGDEEMSLYAERVSFDQAFKLMLKASGNHFRAVGDNSVLIYKDDAETRAKNADYHVRTFYLEAATVEQMRALLERVLDIPNISGNESNNSITVRTTPDKLVLVDKLIRANDRRPAEVSLEVEILEVNRTKSENLGVDFGSQITVSSPKVSLEEIVNGNLAGKLGGSIITLPATSFKYFKQDVDARTLASPRIRTVSQKPATIHIGDRVPLRSATVIDANGKTRTSFEYRDVGIKLEVTPKVLIDQTVEVALNLEVSSLGQNLGTTEESAFSIGTRNIDTNMTLVDNETAIIGGLIRDEDRLTKQKVPGLGEIPAVGKLFQVNDGRGTRTDILLTLTPRIVKGWDIPSPADAEFFSGTGQQVSSQDEFSFLADGPSNGAVIRLDLTGRRDAPTPTSSPVVNAAPIGPLSDALSGGEGDGTLRFDRPVYQLSRGDNIEVALIASNTSLVDPVTFRVRYNQNIVRTLSASTNVGSGAELNFDNNSGVISVSNARLGSGNQSTVAIITLEAIKSGLSYFLIEPETAALSGGVKMGSSKIVVK